jgi:3-oxocholest-4-en-26-oyl-CoA dehydrogenase beta subunit
LGVLPILEAGDDTQKNALLPDIAAAEKIVTLALTEPSAGYEAASISVGARIHQDGYSINGTKLFVPYAHVADSLLCAVQTDEYGAPEKGVTLFLVDQKQPGIACSLLKTMGGDRQCEVLLKGVRAIDKDIVGGLNKGWPIVAAVLDKASVALAAEMIGGAQAVMDMALQYARERVQFGRPIGSFQSIQQYFADMWADITGSRDLLYRTAWKITVNLPAVNDGAMTKAKVGKTYRRVTTLGHQIFGAIGFTEEHDLHLYHKRSIVSDLAFGSAGHHYRKIASGWFGNIN